MAMIMDFCAGFHFHGPPDFHMIASECNWGVAGPHADLAAREHVLVARNSRSGPVFVPTLLVFEYMKQGTWPARDWTRGRQLDFVRSFLDDTAFAHARKYPIVFARATDIADYLRAHPSPQPRRILSSITHDWNYDKVWSPEIYNYNYDVHVGVRPFSESLANIRKNRKYIWAKPASRELIYYEDSQSQCRSSNACPKPMLWYDYGDRRPRDAYEGRPELDVPDPRVELNTTITSARFEVRYRLRGGRNFQGYRLALWDIPREFATEEWKPTRESSSWWKTRMATTEASWSSISSRRWNSGLRSPSEPGRSQRFPACRSGHRRRLPPPPRECRGTSLRASRLAFALCRFRCRRLFRFAGLGVESEQPYLVTTAPRTRALTWTTEGPALSAESATSNACAHPGAIHGSSQPAGTGVA
jgi:hypothetical protein